MKLETSVSGPLLRLLAPAGLLALAACGGSVYSLGNVPGDGGKEGSASSEVCASGESCAGTGSGTGSGFSSSGGGSISAGDDAGTSTVSAGSSSSSGGSGKSSSGSSGGGDGACEVASIACAGPTGTVGYSCTPGVDPTTPTQSCTTGTPSGYSIDFCCFPWKVGDSPCAPLPGFACDGSSYAYQCDPGVVPSTVDSKLSCGSAFPDSNGQSDFCCIYH